LRLSIAAQMKNQVVCLDCGAQFPEHTEHCGGAAYPKSFASDYAKVRQARQWAT
jgi:hypothetical protein